MYLARNGALGFTGDRARASKGGDGFTRVIDRTGGRRWGLAAVPEASGRTRPSFEPTRLTRHQRPGTTGVEGTGGSGGHGRASRRVPARTAPQAPPACRTPGYGGPGCGARGRWQGLAGLRTPSVHQVPPVWRAPEGPEGQAAVPVGGGRAWPGFEATRRAKLAARTARGRAAAHGHTEQPGPTAGLKDKKSWWRVSPSCFGGGLCGGGRARRWRRPIWG